MVFAVGKEPPGRSPPHSREVTALRSRSAADPRAVDELFERGYTVFERAYSPAEVDYFRGHLTRVYDRIGRPKLSANPPAHPEPDVEIGPAGIVFHKLTTHYPEMAPRLYKPRIIDTIRGLLGDDMHLELPAGALSDSSRPFFDWHIHIDGVDDAYYDNKRVYRTFDRSERVTVLLYLDDLTEENGRLLIHPRKLDDPTAPPHDVKQNEWPGQVEIACPRGSMVVLEQCTWHAARQKRSPGVRGFIGSYFAAHDAKRSPLSDESLVHWDGEDELFRSILPRA
jgi:hypothetical protein